MKNLKKHRIKAGLTQKELARAIRCTENYIHMLEAGLRKGSNIGLLKKLSKALKVDIKILIKDVDD